jgi:hypothetical protein
MPRKRIDPDLPDPAELASDEREQHLRDERPGPDDAGQSGDTQGLSGAEGAAAQSVRELVEEGNAWEAGVVSGIENARPAGKRAMRTKEVREDDVPAEYDEREPGDQR